MIPSSVAPRFPVPICLISILRKTRFFSEEILRSLGGPLRQLFLRSFHPRVSWAAFDFTFLSCFQYTDTCSLRIGCFLDNQLSLSLLMILISNFLIEGECIKYI